MRIEKKLKEKAGAAKIRHKVRRDRKKRGLSTDLKALIDEYRAVSPEYAEMLERIMYPS